MMTIWTGTTLFQDVLGDYSDYLAMYSRNEKAPLSFGEYFDETRATSDSNDFKVYESIMKKFGA